MSEEYVADPKSLRQLVEEEIRDLYRTGGFSVRTLAGIYHTDEQSIRKIVKGVRPRTTPPVDAPRKASTADQVCRMYIGFRSIRSIADETGLSMAEVQDLIDRALGS